MISSEPVTQLTFLGAAQTVTGSKYLLEHGGARVLFDCGVMVGGVMVILGVAMGFIGIVIAELLITPTGIGDLITYNSSVADYPQMFAAIVSIVIVAALTIHALERLEHRLFPPEIRGLENAG